MYQSDDSRERSIKRGSISISALPELKRQDAYNVISYDLSYDLNGANLVVSREGIGRVERYIDEAMRSVGKTGEPVCTPCVVAKLCNNPRERRYNANLLAPPGIDKSSKLWSPEMVVPALRIVGRVKGMGGGQKGFVLVSDYLDPNQEFFTPALESLEGWTPESDWEFQGLIKKPNKESDRPFVYIVKDSHQYPDMPALFDQNRMMLKRLEQEMQHGTKFWWNMKLPPEEHHAGRFDPTRTY